MTLKQIAVLRHATRLDKLDKTWQSRSPTPYDSPLVEPLGYVQATDAGLKLKEVLESEPDTTDYIYVHSSPFLRCVQTALIVAQQLSMNSNVVIRIDAVWGEWLTPDYFASIDPPPNDNHQSLLTSSMAWLYPQIQRWNCNKRPNPIKLDHSWSLSRFGNSGEYGEPWPQMHSRFNEGLDNLVSFYDSDITSTSSTVVIITHGAGCNALLGHLCQKPILTQVGLACFCAAKRREHEPDKWDILDSSNISRKHSNWRFDMNDVNSRIAVRTNMENMSENAIMSTSKNNQDARPGEFSRYPGNSNTKHNPSELLIVPTLSSSNSASTSSSSISELPFEDSIDPASVEIAPDLMSNEPVQRRRTHSLIPFIKDDKVIKSMSDKSYLDRFSASTSASSSSNINPGFEPSLRAFKFKPNLLGQHNGQIPDQQQDRYSSPLTLSFPHKPSSTINSATASNVTSRVASRAITPEPVSNDIFRFGGNQL